jgi:hypothetical protein
MAHARQQILAAIAAQVTGLATTGARVFTSRVTDLQRVELPALVLRLGDEQTTEVLTLEAPRLLERTLQVELDIATRADTELLADGLDAQINQILAEIEPVLAMPLNLANAQRITLSAIARPRLAFGEQPVGVATATYAVVYVTQENAPTSAL